MSNYFDIKDLNYYLMIAEALKNSLKEEKDRKICKKWIKLLKDAEFCEESSNIIRKYVLKLLLISLKSNILVGPFKKSPKLNKQTVIIDFLRSISSTYTERDIIKMIMIENYDQHPVLKQSSRITKLCYSIYQQSDNYGGHYYTTLPRNAVMSLKEIDDRILPIGALYIIPKLCKKTERENE